MGNAMEKKIKNQKISKNHKVEKLLTMTSKRIKRYQIFSTFLFDWYEKMGRHDLPWRTKISPYRILVSEVMLQQTQVARVIPKYALWMKHYPSLRSLSQATLPGVLKLWQGLGYQRRAKALLTLSQKVKRLPETYDALIALPGIGTYTASAILSFAFDKESTMLETNIRTALIETFHTKQQEIKDEVLKKDLEVLLALPVVQEKGFRVFYYALMDYGAHLKSKQISHNAKLKGYRKQTPFKDSFRKLRAEVLFSIVHNTLLPGDPRTKEVLVVLQKEGFIKKEKDTFILQDS